MLPSSLKLKIAVVVTMVLISACAGLGFDQLPATPGYSEQSAGSTSASAAPIETCNRAGPRTTIDSYKLGVAHQILRSNLGYTFDGQLPPMLPAVVVMRLSVDSAGKLKDVAIHRSRDEVASAAAVAAILRSGSFPLPCELIAGSAHSLIFSETFLFNSQYQFQLRTIAGPQ